MKPPLNRRVFIIGYAVATPLGRTMKTTWDQAVQGRAGFGPITRCIVDSRCRVVGEIPDWDPLELDFVDAKEIANWNAGFAILTMAVCRDAMEDAGILELDEIKPRTACLIGSALNGSDAYGVAVQSLATRGPNHVNPYLLPNLCANVPSGKAGSLLGFTGPIFSPGGACASGNHALGIGARMIRDGDCDFVLAGGVDMPITPEIVHGFANMNATLKLRDNDRAYDDSSQASRPFSIDRKGFILSEGAGVLILAAEEMLSRYDLIPRAEVMGIGWTSDAYHFTKPHPPTIIRAIQEAIDDAGLKPTDIQYINAHGTSTPKGDGVEVKCLQDVWGDKLKDIPISSNKSQLGHTLGAAAAIEAALTIEGIRREILLPTINHIPDPTLDMVDVIPNEARKQPVEFALCNAFGFGGTNCCVVFRGV